MAKITTPEPEAPASPALPPSIKGAPAQRREHVAAAKMAIPKAGGPVKAAPAPQGDQARRGPFWLCIHPNRWRVLEGVVVPDPKPLHGTPGANGVDQIKQKDGTIVPVMTHAFHAQADQGWTVLDHEIAGPGTSYLQQLESTGGWISIWTTVYPGSRDTKHDGKAEAQWWAKLIADGKIEPCPLHVLTRMERENRRTLDQTLERNRPKDGARVKRLQAAIAAIESEIAKFQSEAA